ncbi:MAG: hypothetical protein GWN07_39680, partial [Actinobacteria bacterium]|nr:hypothetical protein [Actinomycetota bacterium]NIS37078.1 hypothetical protein [Actinomycetota bacterium]NIU71547.1 hypothetical protein [Actinomycetota bacterium]NIW33497.1 hypothetical protein [Actinomycetota bacterium]NIX25603.1 hypothetical protein [Actinomycetota bacterium]
APLDTLARRAPQALVELVHECLAYEPMARPQTASALRERLAPLVTGDLPTVHATPGDIGPDQDTERSRVR